MARFDESIDVNASVSEAYNLFSQFERFPGFMEGVEEVRRTGENKLHWKAEVGGREEEWEALITREEPDTAIAWQSVSGSRNLGEVTFEKLDQDSTQVHLHIEYEPEGFVENVGTFLGVVNGRMRGDLKRFKDLVESGGHASGWHDPAERSRAAADRDRSVGEAKRSVHRDDVGYKGPAGSDENGVAGATGVAGTPRVGTPGSGVASRTVDSAGDRLDQGRRDLADATNDLEDEDVDPLARRGRRDI